MYLRSCLVLLFLACTFPVAAQQRALDNVGSFSAASPTPVKIASADFNHDGFGDLVVASVTKTGTEGHAVLAVHLGDGTGKFSVGTTYQAGSGAGDIEVADINQDGNVDVLVISGDSPASIEIFLGNGDGTLASPATLPNPVAASRLAIEDLDGDHLLDIVAGPVVLWGTAPGQFADPVPLGGGSSAGPYLGDTNNDGRLDLIYPSAQGLSVLMNDGHRSFHSLPIQSNFKTEYLAVGDLNGDGKLDLVGTGSQLDGALVSVGKGDGTFVQSNPALPGFGTGLRELVVTDINNDTYPDFAVIETSLGRVIYTQNDGAGHFSYSRSVSYSWTGGGITTFAANGNNPRDITVTDETESTIWPFLSKWKTVTTMTMTPLYPREGEPIRFDAKVSKFSPDAPGTVSGTVRFFDNNGRDLLGTAELDADGKTTFVVPSLPTGEHILSGWFAGTTEFARSQYTMVMGVNPPGVCPALSTGINICEPLAGDTTDSPLSVLATGAAGTVWMEMWMDGVKKYSAKGMTVDMTLPVTLGNHYLSFYATNAAGVKTKATQVVTMVGPSECRPPTIGTMVSLCTPISGTYLASMVHVMASGGIEVTLMEAWVDGKKIYQSATNWIDTLLTLPPGAHNLSVYGKSRSAVTDKKTVQFTTTGPVCNVPPTPGIAICSPVNGGAVENHSLVSAWANVSGTLARMEMWIDGKKEMTSQYHPNVGTYIDLPYGLHTFTFYAVNTAGTTWKATATANVIK